LRHTGKIVVLFLLVGSARAGLAQMGVERVRTRDGQVLEFERDGAWRAKARAVERRRAALRQAGDLAALNAGGASTAVTGSLVFPTILFGFQDTPTGSLPDPGLYDALYYGLTPPPGRSYSLRTFYREMSNDSLDLQGTRLGWFLGDSVATWYLAACPDQDPTDCPTGRARLHALFLASLAALDQTTDLGQFDNDGPDGFPNSGDDDGSVDVVQFVQPVIGGECSGPGVWAHRWFLSALGGSAYQSADPRTNGGTIRASSYFIVSGVGGAGPGNRAGCGVPSEISGIGTAAHEFGHALGLPDLYDVSGDTEGLGEWGLMGSGSYTSANSPAHFEAWSKERMGWVTVRELTGAGTYLLPPVVTADTVFLIRPPPSVSNPRGEYFLLENKQPQGADTANLLVGGRLGAKLGGLLVWHVDSAQVSTGGFSNGVNAGTIHGVALEEADGLSQLWLTGNRGDAGDPYPGSSGNQAFSPTSTPRAVKNADGLETGFRIESIAAGAAGAPVSFDVSFGVGPLVASVATPPPLAVMGANYQLAPSASGGVGSYAWSVAAGALPAGLILSPTSGLVSGVPSAVGGFTATLRVASGAESADVPITINVVAPQLTTAMVVSTLLGTGGVLIPDERRYLDLLGNRNGSFDLGDFLAFVRTTGGAVSAATMAELLRKAGGQ
jgi:M6 family metalloprotease-like protein